MKVVFRADASLEIGAGHIMRCLTLADFLGENGATCYFICREHEGNLIGYLKERGYKVFVLPVSDNCSAISDHSSWLGASWEEDAELCQNLLRQLSPDWVVVDHYALDAMWEQCIRTVARYICVIDDLHDRFHDCELLIDQTFGKEPEAYDDLLPLHCERMVGADYAVLRNEFTQWRPFSLNRRKGLSSVKRLLISLGGVDKDNVTGRVLKAIENCVLGPDCEVTVVLGGVNPHKEAIIEQASDFRLRTQVVCNAGNMAELMSDSDLAIGAAGSTTWERCCLGVPSVLIVLAENQRQIASQIQQADLADVVFSVDEEFEQTLISKLAGFTESRLSLLSTCSSKVVDGCGTHRVGAYMLEY